MLEILLTIAILAGISVLLVGVYNGFSETVEIRTVTEQLRSDLVHARTRAASGEEGRNFGVRIVSGTPSYYQIFSTPGDFTSASTTIDRRETIPSSISVVEPASGSEKIVLFQSIRGTAAASNIILSARGASSTIRVSAQGVVE